MGLRAGPPCMQLWGRHKPHVANKHADVFQAFMSSDESHNKIVELDQWATRNNGNFLADILFIDRHAIESVTCKHVLP